MIDENSLLIQLKALKADPNTPGFLSDEDEAKSSGYCAGFLEAKRLAITAFLKLCDDDTLLKFARQGTVEAQNVRHNRSFNKLSPTGDLRDIQFRGKRPGHHVELNIGFKERPALVKNTLAGTLQAIAYAKAHGSARIGAPGGDFYDGAVGEYSTMAPLAGSSTRVQCKFCKKDGLRWHRFNDHQEVWKLMEKEPGNSRWTEHRLTCAAQKPASDDLTTVTKRKAEPGP